MFKLVPSPKMAYMPCRLLYVVGQLRLGGLERQLYYLLASLDRARYHPAVVVWNLDSHEKYYGDIERLKIPIYGFHPRRSPLWKLRAFRALSRRVAPEVIHSYGFHTNFAAYYAARGTEALAVGSLRGDFLNARNDGGIVRGAVNACWPRYIISNSLACAEMARQTSGLFVPRHLSVVRNGLDLDSFHSADNCSRAQSYVAAVGSLFPVKRWDRLLRVVQKVKSFGVQNLRIRIAGDGPLLPALQKLTGELGISREVEFQGAIQDMATFLRGAKLLAHTSESEGCPNAVMEAMACGLPVVAMEAGDISYLVEENRTGFVVSQGEETLFAQRICMLLRDDELCTNMGLAARRKAELEFSLARLVSETLAVYKEAGWKDES
jgi:glycosyltransferase involved in cell wall biosynthesis